ncbi:hypothetical protein T05_15226 [Trichinella murrelli]|uniref:Uncharacterized protein n=1 Tax=Trichinella murrelli TaxID=144512 RepID=A0A0V0TEL9_9BILA|nr:hypothetical protein T05_15226 [Trichinella murrelli]
MKRFIAVFRQPVFSPDSLVLIILLEKNSVADSPPFLSCYHPYKTLVSYCLNLHYPSLCNIQSAPVTALSQQYICIQMSYSKLMLHVESEFDALSGPDDPSDQELSAINVGGILQYPIQEPALLDLSLRNIAQTLLMSYWRR